MLFNSFNFIVLVLVTFTFYYLPAFRKFQLFILIASSLTFYWFESATFLLLLLASVAINAFTSYLVVHGRASNRKITAATGVICNLIILSFFKYSALFSASFIDPACSAGQWLARIPLPIGISFYTFQGISLLVDTFKENKNTPSLLIPGTLTQHAKRILFFHSFFPHLVAGPIVKAHNFLPQITLKYYRNIDWELCFKNLVIGYFLKMVVADNLKDFTYWIAFPYFQAHSSITLVTMLLGYSFQIFADFAGYSLIAVGLARLFGYQLINNFNFPYIASSFKDFWKRWHISLSSFLMEYLYFPLGGNKKGLSRTYINLMITMALGGLWHGATWCYALWGLFHGTALVIERYITSNTFFRPSSTWIIAKRWLVFLFVSFGWLLFKLPEFSQVIEFVKTVVNNYMIPFDLTICSYIILYSLPVIVYHLFYLYNNAAFFSFIKSRQYILYGFMLYLILTNSGTKGSFIYFQF